MRSRICAAIGANIADKGSGYYYHFRVNDAITLITRRTGYGPLFNKTAPPSGYPVLYMLDSGNAVMDRLPESALLKYWQTARRR